MSIDIENYRYKDNIPLISKNAFEMAQMYHQVAGIIINEETLEDGFHWLIPSSVNATFACELYIKSILYIKSPKIICEHDLKKLFLLLSKEQQDNVKQIVAKEPYMNFDNSLNNTKHLFKEWRYVFEKKKHYILEIDFIGIFTDALELIAKEAIVA